MTLYQVLTHEQFLWFYGVMGFCIIAGLHADWRERKIRQAMLTVIKEGLLTPAEIDKKLNELGIWLSLEEFDSILIALCRQEQLQVTIRT